MTATVTVGGQLSPAGNRCAAVRSDRISVGGSASQNMRWRGFPCATYASEGTTMRDDFLAECVFLIVVMIVVMTVFVGWLRIYGGAG